jgi:heme-degrading monooxygenase HmoA
MFMRFVHYHVQVDRVVDFRRRYEEVSIPTLKTVHGCLSATLIESVGGVPECVSMTLWESKDAAEEYERSDVFRTLLESSRPFLAQSSEWKIQLTQDLRLEYQPVADEPIVEAFEVMSLRDGEEIPKGDTLFVRIVSPQVRVDSVAEFKKLYLEQILPELRRAPGCRYAYLVENSAGEEKLLSVSIWNSLQDAEAYEASGAYDLLTSKVQHTFSRLLQWKMQLEKEKSSQIVTTEDTSVKGYSVVVGRKFV